MGSSQTARGSSAATTSGELDHGRLVSFRKLQREAAAEARKTDPVQRRSRTGRVEGADEVRPAQQEGTASVIAAARFNRGRRP